MQYPHHAARPRFFAPTLMAACLLMLTPSAMLAPVRAEGFLSALNDMPLADGVVEIEDGALVFDKPEGRIVQVTTLLAGASTPASIRQFYLDTLPNLGWQAGAQAPGRLTFTRKGEILRITLTADLVIFDLAPNHLKSSR